MEIFMRNFICVLCQVFISINLFAGPLHEAAEKGDNAKLLELLNGEADINEGDKNQDTPLHWAAFNGHIDAVRTLLRRNAEVNRANINGWIPLHAAAINGHSDIVALLLAHHADANAEDANGDTPLRLAVESSHPETVRALVLAGAEYGPLHHNITILGINPLELRLRPLTPLNGLNLGRSSHILSGKDGK
jgi:ankyrin repeat protein